MSLRRRPASKPTVVTRSRSPHTQRVSTNRGVESFIHFNATRVYMIELLADEHVKIVKGPNHGCWKPGENEDFIVHWHYRGIPDEVRRHHCAKIRSAQAW